MLEGCDGSCVTGLFWCPDCDRLTKHVWISQDAVECQQCGEISERTRDERQPGAMTMRRTICVDMDGVLASYRDGWQGVDTIGAPIPGAREFLHRLREHYDVVIFTTRCNPEVNRPEQPHLLANRVRDWLDEHDMPYDAIYTGVGKPIAAAYVDDRAVLCRPEDGDDADAWQTTWNRVREIAG